MVRRCFVMMSGRSTRGLEDRFCGWTDPPLSQQGRQAVLTLRQRLSEQGVSLPKIWYVSDRRRAVESFEIMAAGMHAPVVRLSDRLRELNFGDFENLTWEELPLDFQSHYERCLRDPLALRFPGGESFRDLCDRVSSAALDILSYEADESDIGIVGHQGSMRLWFMMAEGLPAEAFFADTPSLGDGRWLTLSVAQVAAWRRRVLGPPGL